MENVYRSVILMREKPFPVSQLALIMTSRMIGQLTRLFGEET